MAKKRVSKSVKRRLTFLGPILLGIVIFCIFTIFSYAYQIHQLKLEEQKLETPERKGFVAVEWGGAEVR